MRKNQGFTLVEILIVVVILGILAAIVIPQFSDASTQSKVSSAASSIQTMRSQIALYKIQHSDTPPSTTDADFITAMTTAVGGYGPYLQSVPKNPFNQESLINGAGGWDYTVDANGNVTLWLDPTDVPAGALAELQDKGVCAPAAP